MKAEAFNEGGRDVERLTFAVILFQMKPRQLNYLKDIKNLPEGRLVKEHKAVLVVP